MSEKLFNPRQEIYPLGSSEHATVKRIATVAAYGAFLSAVLAILVAVFKLQYAQGVIYALAALWAIGAPSWFFYEYFFIYREVGVEGSWDLFKHGQQLAVAIWAGLTATLTVFGASDFVKEQKVECELRAQPISNSTDAQLVAICKGVKGKAF